jgi:hypothetical protein
MSAELRTRSSGRPTLRWGDGPRAGVRPRGEHTSSERQPGGIQTCRDRRIVRIVYQEHIAIGPVKAYPFDFDGLRQRPPGVQFAGA